MNKRGMSPLFATFLLILISAGLGTVVMSWGEKYIEEKAEFVQGVREVALGCDVLNVNFIQLGGKSQVCSKGNVVNLFFDNGPESDVENFHARVLGDKGVFVKEKVLQQPLKMASSVKASFTLSDVGQIKQLKVTPIIKAGTDMLFCNQKALYVENVPEC